jgi:hypothetical protein
MTLSRRALPFAFAVLAATAGCIHHSLPLDPAPNRAVSATEAAVFVDQDGTLYPPAWETTFGRPGWRGAQSLILHAKRDVRLRDSIPVAETRILDSLERFIAPKRRVFILVHGFNNDQSDADTAYALIKRVIDAGPEDAVLSFYWDGLKASGPLTSGRIWFNATGYSQLAGQRGLRRVLDRIHGKDIYLIAHSRGASVALSAFSNPPYRPSFARATLSDRGIDVASIEPVRENGNAITAVFLAPAMGPIDFRSPRWYSGDTSYRDLGAQVRRIHHTVNQSDPVLRKPLPGLSDKFNPTNLGYDPAVAAAVGANVPRLTHRVVLGLPVHAFTRYVTDASFREVLRDAGVPVKDAPAH